MTVSGWNDDANTTAPRLATGVKAALGHTDLDREALAGAVAAGATLSTTEAALFEWCQVAGTSQFKQISALVRQTPPAQSEP